ncbi:unnamed protein product [Ilex paraguariensis]|uniref:C2H2-type domain-containing protein n=1 Tax=Ilex paraguariensis TaxID=185542 RepID=A0ABC8U445_9AQUA
MTVQGGGVDDCHRWWVYMAFDGGDGGEFNDVYSAVACGVVVEGGLRLKFDMLELLDDRVPRSLLPGARSSRLRDRQKEERELLVKKACIQDILIENNLLTTLLRKNLSYHGVLWDLDSLPSSRKESGLCSTTANVAITAGENVSSEKDNSEDLYSQMRLYMETVNDLYVDDDDVSCDFQIDSGTLPCVACGILGFPFMSLVQPSEKASLDLLPVDHQMIQNLGGFKAAESLSSLDLDGMVEGSVPEGLDCQDKSHKEKISSACNGLITASGTPKSGSEFKLTKDGEKSSTDAYSFSMDATGKMKPNNSNFLQHPNGASSSVKDKSPVSDHSPSLKDLTVTSEGKFEKGWNTSSGFLRPRIFCLEHAIQIEELLHSKGGANVLVICHSDFQKIKAHAAAIAEEIGSPFNYNEISLDNASHEDLNLINLAIDDEDQDECGEDWTSRLGVNLQHCVKVRKNIPSKKVQHALSLNGLFSDSSHTTPSPSALSFKWQSRKSRSKQTSNRPTHSLPSKAIQIKKNEDLGAKSDGQMVRKEGKIIQYRRRNKSKSCGSAGESEASVELRYLPVEVSAAEYENPDKNCRKTSKTNLGKVEDTGNSSSGLVVSALSGKSELQNDGKELVTTGALNWNSVPAQVTHSLVATSPVVENIAAQNSKVEDTGNRSSGLVESALSGKFELQHDSQELVTTGDLSGNSVPSQVTESFVTAIPIIESVVTQIMLKEMTLKDNACDSTWDDFQVIKVVEGSSEKNERCYSEKSAGSSAADLQSTKTEIVTDDQITEDIIMTNEACGPETADDYGGKCEVQADGDILMKEVSDFATSLGSCADGPSVGSSDELLEKPVQEKICMNDEVHDCATLNINMHLELRTRNSYGDVLMEEVPCPANPSSSCADDPPVGNFAEQLEKAVAEKFCMNNEVHDCVTLDSNFLQDNLIANETNDNNPVRGNVTLIDESSPVLVEGCLKVPGETQVDKELQSDGENSSLQDKGELDNTSSSLALNRSTAKKGSKRKRKAELQTKDVFGFNDFIRSPCERLRPRAGKDANRSGIDSNKTTEERPATRKVRKCSDGSVPDKDKRENKRESQKCDLEGCRMRFQTKAELVLHKRNQCPHEGCRKKFSSHKYAVLHQRVHDDDRPLKCPWKGCTMSFKWAWARTEHLRVHTGARPYECKVEGCGLTFRFVSDFSRHRRKTGHYVNVPA